MKHSTHSLGGLARWKGKTAKEKKLAIQKMNEARIKTMQENKRDAEAYRELKLKEIKAENLTKTVK